MTPDQLIALAASLGACMSALATFLTVRQIAEQRKASYRPELAFSRVHFQGRKDPAYSGRFPTKWVTANSAAPQDDGQELHIPLRNIGLGTAKSVALAWDFDIQSTVDHVNQLAQRALVPVFFEYDRGFLNIKSEGGGGGASMWRNQQEVLIDYVLPAAVQKEAVPVHLPHAYIEVCSALLHLSLTGDNKKEVSLALPPLTLTLKFKDIGREDHQATFELNVYVVHALGNGEQINGYVESAKRV